MRQWIDFDGLNVPVVVQSVRGSTWLHVDGETFVIEPEVSTAGGKKTKAVNTGDLTAPMPGKITKLLKKVGEPVSEGDVLVVMEAMKMEYSLKAGVSGVLSKVNCSVGDQVTLGKILCSIDSAQGFPT